MESNKKPEVVAVMRPTRLVLALSKALNQLAPPTLVVVYNPVLMQHRMIEVPSEQLQSPPVGALS